MGFMVIYVFYGIECQYSELICDLAETELMPIPAVSEYIIRLKRAEPRVWYVYMTI